MKSLGLFVTLLGLTVSANAEILCKNGKSERSLTVAYESPDKKVPCSVKYKKEGQESTIFTAAAQEGYCEEKAKNMQDKLAGMGWECAEAEK